MAQHNDTGKWGEQLAVEYLRKKGYTIRDTNWRSGHCELDIVALTEDMRTLVFVEVKTRHDSYLMMPEEAVDLTKIRRLGRAANAYVKWNRIVQDLRFDIITIIGRENGDAVPSIEHWEDAFNPMLAY